MTHLAQKYPSWRFHRTADPVIVQNAEQDARLTEDWHDAPWPVEPPVTAEDAEMTAPPLLSAAQARDLHTSTVAEVVARINEVTSLDTLAQVAAAERLHPKNEGGRKTVLTALASRRDALTAA